MSRIRAILNSLTPERIKNIRIITLSIIVAGTFWFLNALNGSYSTTLRYPIKFLFDKEKYMPVRPVPENVLINVSGLGWNLLRINLGINTTPVIFRLENPSDVKKLPGTTLLASITDQLDEFNVNFVLTDTLYLQIDKRVQRTYALKVDSLNIDLENNYWITTPINSNPDSVTLIGPESILNLFDDVIVVNTPQQNIDENYNEDIPIEVINNNLITRNPPTIHINFEVEEYSNRQVNLPITTIGFPEDSSAVLINKNAIISFDVGTNKQNENFENLFSISANYNELIRTDSTVGLKLDQAPEFVKNITIVNDTIKVVFP